MRRGSVILVFCIAIASGLQAQTFTKLADFDGTNGIAPSASLIQAKDGNFYGTTQTGGTSRNCGGYGCGTVFKVTSDGSITTLHSFNGSDGWVLFGGLVQATDGDFYGTTQLGGANGQGTVFKMTAYGALSTLHNFGGNDGANPYGTLVQGSDGNLYGTTGAGGVYSNGTVFKITPDGTLTTLHSFSHDDGNYPLGGLVQGTDGNFYGTTYTAGLNSGGTIFKITAQGMLTTLYNFCSQDNCVDGSASWAGLVQGTDGNFYGVTAGGGFHQAGTVFKITPQGGLTTLYSFCAQSGCVDGTSPASTLVQANDGNFYGTTLGGGPHLGGTIFKITAAGTLTTLYSFRSQDGYVDGWDPSGGLVQGRDGSFYGTNNEGGSYNDGTVFRLSVFAVMSVSRIGSGTVGSADGHIYCGSLCSYSCILGNRVTVSAIPAPGYTFADWTGCDNVNGSYCSVTMTSARNVSATFTTANVTLTSLTFKPSYVRGGQLSAGTLSLNAPAPPGGVTVALSSDHPGVAHPPAFVFIPAGKSSAGFAVNTFPVKSNTTVSITATAGSSHVSGTLMVGTTSLPPSMQ